MGKDTTWLHWKDPATVGGLMMIVVLIAAATAWFAGSGVKLVFEFDDGTTQAWTADGIFDDTGTKHDGSLYKVAHAETYQSPGGLLSSDPPKDKKGSLCVSIAQLDSDTNFPSDGSYWRLDVVSPVLSKHWQKSNEFEAYVGDICGVDPGHVRAIILLNVEKDGAITSLTPTSGAAEQVVSKSDWTKLSAKFTIPSGGYIQNIVVRFKGDWNTYELYEGTLYVDHVAATN